MISWINSLSLAKPFVPFLSSIALSLTTALIIWLFRAKVKLVWGSTSASYHSVGLAPSDGTEAPSNLIVWTEKYYVQNAGKKPATNIEIVFNSAPSSYTLWPPRQHDAKMLLDGTASLKIPSLAPGELLIVDALDIHMQSLRLLAVNCPDAISKRVAFYPQRELSVGVKIIVAYFMLAGLIGSIYAALLGLRAIIT